MRFQIIAASVLLIVFLSGCGSNPIADPAPQPTSPVNDNTNQSLPRTEAPDLTNLPKEGPGDPTLTYDLVHADPGKYCGKRVTFAFAPLSSDGKRMMCALDMNAALGPEH